MSLYADGGDLTLATLQGKVLIDRRAPKVAPSGPLAGNVTLEGAVLGTNGVTVLDEIGDAGPGSNAPTGGIAVDSNVASGGGREPDRLGRITVAPGVTVRSESRGAGGGGLHVEGRRGERRSDLGPCRGPGRRCADERRESTLMAFSLPPAWCRARTSCSGRG